MSAKARTLIMFGLGVAVVITMGGWLQAPIGLQDGGVTPQGVKWEWENISAPDATAPVIEVRASKPSEKFSVIIWTNRWDNWSLDEWSKEFLQKTVDTCYIFDKRGVEAELINEAIYGRLIAINGQKLNY